MVSRDKLQQIYIDSLKIVMKRLDSWIAKDPTRSVGQMIDHHARGKIVEEHVRQFILNANPNNKITDVDYNTRNSALFDADLILNGDINIHIKHCDPSMMSWMFDENDPVINNNSVKDVIVLCVYHGIENIEIRHKLKASANFPLSDPKKKSITGKKCIDDEFIKYYKEFE